MRHATVQLPNARKAGTGRDPLFRNAQLCHIHIESCNKMSAVGYKSAQRFGSRRFSSAHTIQRPARACFSANNGNHVHIASEPAPGLSQHERAALTLIKSALAGQMAPEEAAKEVTAVMATAVANTMQQPIDPAQYAAQQASAFAAAEAELKQQGRVPEVVFGPGKSPDQVAAMLQSIAQRQRIALATRIEPDMYAAVRKIVPGVEYNGRARLLTLRSPHAADLPKTDRLPGAVAIVSGGSADQAVAEECRLLAEHLGCFCFSLPDLGLGNGLNRLLGCLSALRAADVVVVVCGLDGALASVVAGLVDAPVIAVPTSSGYGATLGGAAPLLAQLSCTTPGVTVVNVDNGFGAAMSAQKMLRMASKLLKTRTAGSAQNSVSPASEVEAKATAGKA